jgi:CRISPR/Cas system-associated endonuclease Cas1
VSGTFGIILSMSEQADPVDRSSDEVFVEGFGLSVSKKSERLVMKRKGEIIFERPFFNVELVIVATEGTTISSSVVHECVKNGIPIELKGYSGRPYARLVSLTLGGTVKTRRAQLLPYDDLRGVEIGKAFATGKLKNSANNQMLDGCLHIEREFTVLGDELDMEFIEVRDEKQHLVADEQDPGPCENCED